MDITLKALTGLVAKAIDEFPDFTSGGWSLESGCSLSDMVATGLSEKANEAVRVLSLKDCDFLVSLSDIIGQAEKWESSLYYSCALPSDFQRLHTLRLTDWPCSLSEEYPGDSLRIGLGLSAPEWLASRPSRPMLHILPADSASEARLIFGPAENLTVMKACYVPVPLFDRPTSILRRFQSAALPGLVKEIAGEIKEAMG